MDRRDNTETGLKPAEDHLKKALGVIIESYKGAEPERLYREAILCFDALIDISLNTEAIRDFASRNNIDIKYLVDGANFVISKMHFNPEDNYYITLGVRQNAMIDDIRDRWKRLMLLYHPDRQEGGNEWVSERAKKVNEAYTELKDSSRRSAFDRKLAEQTVRIKPARNHNAGTIPAPKRSRSTIRHDSARWARAKKYLPKALIGFYLAAAAVFIVFIYYQNNSSSLENEFLQNYSSTSQHSREADAEQLKTPDEEKNIHETFSAIDKKTNAVSDIKGPLQLSPPSQSEPLRTDKKTFQTDPQRPSASSSYNIQEKSFSAQKEKEKIHSSKMTAQKQAAEPLIAPSTAASVNSSLKNEDAQTKPSVQRYGPSEQKNVLPYTEKLKTVTQTQVQEEKAGPVYNFSQEITKDEVEEFIQKYITAYKKNDLGTFMSLFSRSAVENNTAYYNDIQKAYKETFSKELNYYKVKDLNIKIDGRHALVTGFYHANRYLSSEEQWLKLSGNIQWKLAKENNILKIMSINYDK